MYLLFFLRRLVSDLRARVTESPAWSSSASLPPLEERLL